jgi:hypothetical protein
MVMVRMSDVIFSRQRKPSFITSGLAWCKLLDTWFILKLFRWVNEIVVLIYFVIMQNWVHIALIPLSDRFIKALGSFL